MQDGSSVAPGTANPGDQPLRSDGVATIQRIRASLLKRRAKVQKETNR